MRPAAPIIAIICFVSAVYGYGCLPGWRLYSGHCYKHFNDPRSRVTYDQAQQRCRALGARLTDVKDRSELQFIGQLTKTPGKFIWADCPLVGLYKTGRDNAYNVYDKSKPYLNWCKDPPEPNNHNGIEHCIIVLGDAAYVPGYNLYWPPRDIPCMMDIQCDGRLNAVGFSRYVCKAREGTQLVCDKPNTEASNGKCVCKQGFIDITETDVPERRKYNRGEKCISKDPCKDVRSFSLLFLVDSSESIGRDNWDSLVDFLRSGADYLPTSTRVGFVKFSTNISFAEFLPDGWSKAKFNSFVPSMFDDGETNTAAAFDTATQMFKKDYNKNQVAVLITDGLPFSGYVDEAEMMEKTAKAAKSLRSKKITLIALGYGKNLNYEKAKVIRSWLDDPEEDYFEYDKNACDLKSVHMCLLMRKVCRRFVQY